MRWGIFFVVLMLACDDQADRNKAALSAPAPAATPAVEKRVVEVTGSIPGTVAIGQPIVISIAVKNASSKPLENFAAMFGGLDDFALMSVVAGPDSTHDTLGGSVYVKTKRKIAPGESAGLAVKVRPLRPTQAAVTVAPEAAGVQLVTATDSSTSVMLGGSIAVLP